MLTLVTWNLNDDQSVPDSSVNINSLTYMYWASVAELIVPKVGAEPYTEVCISQINQAP